ncbi:MAG: OB-fold domain-containing protein [Cycloclasticus sp.]|nr:OB-fold domain-containing protein [Cycloclasticus sp.]
MTASNTKFAGPGPDQVYLDHLRQQNFSLPRCQACGEFHFFPRVVCPHCGSYDLEWQALSGKAEVYSTTTIRRKPERGGNYNVSLITLEEGPRLMSRVEGIDSELVKIGAKVCASINNDGDEPFVVFTPAQEV